MSSKTPKTGLAEQIRAWMRGQKRGFTVMQMCEGLGIPPGKERDRVRNAIPDFISRGEIVRVPREQNRRQSCENPPFPPLQKGGNSSHLSKGGNSSHLPLSQRGTQGDFWKAQKYRYNHAVALGKKYGKLAEKIYKAMRLISFHEPFAIADVMRMTGMKDRSYIDKLTRELLDGGHLKREGYRTRQSMRGRECLYRVTNLDKFRIEVMR